MSGDPTFQIDVSFRNFKFTRGYAVKDTQDALTELLTNACDAYLNIDNSDTAEKYIYIIFHQVKNQTGGYDYYLQVTDNATGVDPENMKSCFLVAGSKTSSSDQARGFFSTGAKNITILGDVHFTSIKNGTLSKVYLDDQVYGHIVTHGPYDQNDPTKIPDVVGVSATQTQRDILNISQNGLNVVLAFTNTTETSKFSSLSAINDMLTTLKNIATLRDIFSNPKIHVIKDIRSHAPYLDILNTGDYKSPIIHTDPTKYDPKTPSDNFGGMYYERIVYTYPEAKLLLSTTFIVPNYPQYQAKFVIYKTTKPIPQPPKENQMEFGFLIKDSNAIHEVNTLGINERYRWNPNINYLYGYVFCDGFAEELKRYDQGLTDELIIDPNRVGGINRNHSLYVNILSVCLPRLDTAVLDVQGSTSYNSINIQELDSIISKLEDLGADVFSSNNISFNFVPDDQGDLALALQKTQNNILTEINANLNLKIADIDKTVLDEIVKRQSTTTTNDNYVYYLNKNDEIKAVDISNDTKTETKTDSKGDGKSQTTISNDPSPDFENNLHKVVNNLNDLNVTTPYIYRFTDGQWTKAQIYVKGRMERSSNYDNSKIKLSQKTLTIQFINDINHNDRYLIDTTNGVIIKINLHNQLVADKLSKTKIDLSNVGANNGVNFNISDKASYDALHFLELMIIDAFTDIIVNNDIATNKIASLVDTGSSLAMKALDHWNQVETQVEPLVHALFTEFINKKREQMKTSVISGVDSAKTTIMQLFSSTTTTMTDIENNATQLSNAILTAINDVI